MDQSQPESIKEYVPGVANGRHYMTKLCHLPGGPWRIEVIHVESLAPLHGSDANWATREEATHAAANLVAALAC